MRKFLYEAMTRKECKAHDLTIIATLTGLPRFVEEWDNYAASTDAGGYVTGETARECQARKEEANELTARHNRAYGKAQQVAQ